MRSRPLRKLPDWNHAVGSAERGFVACQFRVRAAASELQEVRRRSEEAAAKFGLGARDRYQFVFAVNEAVTNAIRHGQADKDGTIGVRIHADGDTLTCSVYDSGPFLPTQGGSDLLAEHGRGFRYMALLLDQIELSTASDQTVVRLHKRRGTGAEPAT
jgi:anti-sigma regulatory factor (Ser/Thr protein kinase)